MACSVYSFQDFILISVDCISFCQCCYVVCVCFDILTEGWTKDSCPPLQTVKVSNLQGIIMQKYYDEAVIRCVLSPRPAGVNTFQCTKSVTKNNLQHHLFMISLICLQVIDVLNGNKIFFDNKKIFFCEAYYKSS